MKHIVIALSALALLTLWSLLGSHSIGADIGDIIELMDNCENSVDAGKWEEGEDFALQALSQWENILPGISVICRADEVDDVTLVFNRTAECLFEKRMNDFKLENTNLITLLDKLVVREQLTVKNIF